MSVWFNPDDPDKLEKRLFVRKLLARIWIKSHMHHKQPLFLMYWIYMCSQAWIIRKKVFLLVEHFFAPRRFEPQTFWPKADTLPLCYKLFHVLVIAILTFKLIYKYFSSMKIFSVGIARRYFFLSLGIEPGTKQL